MLDVIMLSIIMLSVAMLIVVKLGVVWPFNQVRGKARNYQQCVSLQGLNLTCKYKSELKIHAINKQYSLVTESMMKRKKVDIIDTWW